MKNKIKLLKIIVICFLCLGCASTIKRSGYSIPSKQTHDYQAKVIVLRNASFLNINHTVIGKVHVGDSGVSLKCNEYYVLGILERDALDLNADIINITKEIQPNMVSSCYRVDAEFVKFNDKDDLLTFSRDPGYSLEQVLFRNKHQRAYRSSSQDLKSDVVGAVVSGVISGAMSQRR